MFVAVPFEVDECDLDLLPSSVIGSDDSRQGALVDRKKKPLVRGVLVAALAITVVIGVGVLLYGVGERIVRQPEHRHDDAARGRNQRVTPAAVIALPQLPVKVPLIERPGKDKNGYPRSYVDRVGLRALLIRAKYQDLTRYLEQFQRDFETDFHAEYFVNDAAEAFETAERDLEPKLDAWVSATPDSFAPYLARGAHRFAVGVAGRGFEYVQKTHPENFSAMDAAFRPAVADLEQALSKNSRVVPALRNKLRIAFIGSEYRAQFEHIAKRAFAVCPGCFQVRVSHMVGLQPRWGGSYLKMAEAARAAPTTVNPRFATLAGHVDDDRSHVASEEGDLAAALRHIERACALGDQVEFLRRRGNILARQNQMQLALESLTKALELRPQDPDTLFERVQAYSYKGTQDWRAAYPDLMLALQLQPAAQEARESLGFVANGLTFLGWQAHKEGRNEEAIRLLDQAAELLPSRDLEARRFAVLTSGFDGSDEEIAKLETEANAHPNDFYAHQRFDYALSKRRDWNRILAIWNRFIQANPENGRAYYERSGTLSQLRRSDASLADLARACELGVSAACSREGGQAGNR